MFISRSIFAFLIALAAMGTADAQALRPMEGRHIDLGEVSGTVYYTVERGGFRVVATLCGAANSTPIRVEALLAPGQSVMLSTPHAAGVAADAVEIRHRDDRILVEPAPITAAER